MNHPYRRYVLDSNVLITAYHDYYAPDICVGFWEGLGYYFQSGEFIRIDRVRAEVLSPPQLVQWIDENLNQHFLSTASQPVIDSYSQVMEWVQRSEQFLPAARDELARVADGWLVAYALENGMIVVTNEVRNPDSRRRVPLPNLCEEFRVRCIDTFDLLRELGTSFGWTQ